MVYNTSVTRKGVINMLYKFYYVIYSGSSWTHSNGKAIANAESVEELKEKYNGTVNYIDDRNINSIVEISESDVDELLKDGYNDWRCKKNV